MDDNEDGESQKFLSNGMMKKKKYEEYHEEYVRGFIRHNAEVVRVCQSIQYNTLLCRFEKHINIKNYRKKCSFNCCN